MWDLGAMDTYHPLLPLDNEVENIPLEVDRQQGWGPNWGGNGDIGGSVSRRRVSKDQLLRDRWPPAQGCLSATSCRPSSRPPQSIGTDQALKVGMNASLKKGESPMNAERVSSRAWHSLPWKRTAGETMAWKLPSTRALKKVLLILPELSCRVFSSASAGGPLLALCPSLQPSAPCSWLLHHAGERTGAGKCVC